MIPILDVRDALGVALADPRVAEGLAKVAEEAGDLTPPEQVDDLPDRAFGLVFDRPSGRERRYPLDTAEHTRLALAEFGAFGRHVQPEETARIAGAHTVHACERFGIEIPDELKRFHDPTVVSNLAPPPASSSPKTAEDIPPEHFALTVQGSGRYPLRTPEEVKAAGQYFATYHRDISPAHRHPFARKTAERARALGVSSADLPPEVHAWAGSGWSPLLKQALVSRVATAADVDHRRELLDLCREKAHLTPDTFAEGLYRIDRKHGCADYGRSVVDPWTAVFFGAGKTRPDSAAAKVARDTRVICKAAANGRLQDLLEPGTRTAFPEDVEAIAKDLDSVALAALASLPT